MKLHTMLMPPEEFDHVEKGDAQYGKYSFVLYFFHPRDDIWYAPDRTH